MHTAGIYEQKAGRSKIHSMPIVPVPGKGPGCQSQAGNTKPPISTAQEPVGSWEDVPGALDRHVSVAWAPQMQQLLPVANTQISRTCSPQGAMMVSQHPPLTTWLLKKEISDRRSGRFQGSLCTSAAAPEPPWPHGQCLAGRVSAQHQEWYPPNCSWTPTRCQEQLQMLWMVGAELGMTGHILNKKAPGEEESGGQHPNITLPPT